MCMCECVCVHTYFIVDVYNKYLQFEMTRCQFVQTVVTYIVTQYDIHIHSTIMYSVMTFLFICLIYKLLSFPLMLIRVKH